jgi:hypothetical protein
VTTKLTDGTEVTLREIRADDKELLAAGHARLSEKSRLKRFLASKPKLTASDLRYLTEVDGVNHYAVVALVGGDIVGVARWVRLVGEPESAEAAVAARRRGVKRITASVMSDNPPAEALMRVIAARLTDAGHHHGVHELVAELAA